MHILGIDTSSIVATVAVLNEEKLLAEYIVNNKKNHSEKLMEVLDKVLKDAYITLNDIDVVAVSKGPGSFTGIRIGMACAQGIVHALGKPIIGVNTLDGLAYNLIGQQDLVCSVINAQRQEVYTSLYRWDNSGFKSLWDYKIVKAEELIKELSKLDQKVVLLGDGVPVLKDALKNHTEDEQEFKNLIFAHPNFLMPRASSIAAIGLREYKRGNFDSCFSIRPFYIRKSSAEEKWEERECDERK
jgi:tRNA threonylcarbamoyladenosine biosynthesis protein TsaB